MKNFVVLRIANKQDGTTVAPVKTFEDEQSAQKEFFRSAAAAVDSDNLTDAVSLLTKEGFEVRHEYFTHPAVAPEPTPEEPEEEPEEVTEESTEESSKEEADER